MFFLNRVLFLEYYGIYVFDKFDLSKVDYVLGFLLEFWDIALNR